MRIVTELRHQIEARSRRSERGFSFIEVIIALSLFAAGAALIVGLESSAINRTVRDRNAQQAMLAARRIMASIETAGSRLELGDQENRPVVEVLQALGAPQVSDDKEKEQLDSLSVTLRIQEWNLPFENVQNPSMKKVDLVLAWGDGVGESLRIDYLYPNPPQQQ
jgi:prepilin-type N-terminal cleavage/methylation domain-containing protein